MANRITKDIVIDAIKNAGYRWDKASYSYAIAALDHWHPAGQFPQSYKLAEIKDIFFDLAVKPENKGKLIRLKVFSYLK